MAKNTYRSGTTKECKQVHCNVGTPAHKRLWEEAHHEEFVDGKWINGGYVKCHQIMTFPNPFTKTNDGKFILSSILKSSLGA